MLYLVVKAVVSGVLIATISEVARRNPGWGGFTLKIAKDVQIHIAIATALPGVFPR
jgi:hypothetical protein